MKFPEFRFDFVDAAKGVVLATMLVAASPAGAEPTVTYNHPPGTNLLGGQPVRQVDCGTLAKIPGTDGKIRLFASCEFTRQVDANGQTVCSDPNPLPTDPQALRQHFPYALGVAIQHFGRQHGVCIPQAVQIDRQLGKSEADLDKLYPGWRGANTHCPLTEASQQCRAAMGLEPVTK